MPGGISCIELEHYSQNSWYPVKFTPGVKASFFLVLDTFLGSPSPMSMSCFHSYVNLSVNVKFTC